MTKPSEIVSLSVKSGVTIFFMHNTPDMCTMLICECVGYRGFSFIDYTIQSNVMHCTRAFFIVSLEPVRKEDIQCGMSSVLSMYGGLCMQLFRHYHYYVILEHTGNVSDVVVRGKQCNITPVSSSTSACRRYISAQLTGDEYFVQDGAITRSNGIMNWKYYDYYYSQLTTTVKDAALKTNETCLGGVYEPLRTRGEMGQHLVCEYLPHTGTPNHFVASTYYSKFTHDIIDAKKYMGQYNVVMSVSSRGMDKRQLFSDVCKNIEGNVMFSRAKQLYVKWVD